MALLQIVSWRDIPARVVVTRGATVVTRVLSERFVAAIERAARREGIFGSQSDGAQWRHGPPMDCGDDLEVEAAAAAERIEQGYDGKMLAELSAAGGHKT